MLSGNFFFSQEQTPGKTHILTASLVGVVVAHLLGVLEAVQARVRKKRFPWSSPRSSFIAGKGKKLLV